MAPFLEDVVTPNVAWSNHSFNRALAIVLTLEHSAMVGHLGVFLDHRDKLAASMTTDTVFLRTGLMVPAIVGDSTNTATLTDDGG